MGEWAKEKDWHLIVKRGQAPPRKIEKKKKHNHNFFKIRLCIALFLPTLKYLTTESTNFKIRKIRKKKKKKVFLFYLERTSTENKGLIFREASILYT